MKTRKGGLKQKREIFFLKSHGRRKQKNERVMTGQHLKPLRGPLPFSKPKIWTPRSKKPSPELSSLSRWVLTPVKLPYSGTKNNESFQNAWFSKNSFFQKKGPLKSATSCAQPNCENKSNESDHQISSKCPIRRFSNSDHQFFGSLKSKERWLFMNNKSSFENILVSGVVEASFWK